MLDIRREWYGQHCGWLKLGECNTIGWYFRLWSDWYLIYVKDCP